MPQFHVAYSPTEDRLLLSFDDQEPVVALTRRLTRELLKSTAKIVAEQKSGTPAADQLVRDTVLSFEHSKAVTEAYAEGRARQENRQAPSPSVVRLASSVDIVIKKNQSITFVFKDGEPLFSLPFSVQTTYVFMSTIVDMAAKAGWDFPEIASWLEQKSLAEQEQSVKVLH